MDRRKLEKEAKKRLAAKLSFLIHGGVFTLTTILLVGINLAFTPNFWWFIFPLAGGLLGLMIHGLIVFIALNKNLKRNLIEKEMRRLSGEKKELSESKQTFNYVPMSWKESETSEVL